MISARCVNVPSAGVSAAIINWRGCVPAGAESTDEINNKLSKVEEAYYVNDKPVHQRKARHMPEMKASSIENYAGNHQYFCIVLKLSASMKFQSSTSFHFNSII